MDETTPPLRPQLRPQGLQTAASEEAVTDALAEALASGGDNPLRPVARRDGNLQVPPEVAEAATTPEALDTDRMALIGLFHGPESSAALLRLASGRVVRVEAGAVVAGALVSAIGPDSLRLQRGGEETVLTIAG
jgi:hypothetical protein